jgi:hypothetical protein
MAARLTAWPLLWFASGCLPNGDLSRYGSEWSEAAAEGSGAAPENGIGAGGTSGADAAGPAGASGAGSAIGNEPGGGAEGVVGGGMLPLAGAGGLPPNAPGGDAGVGLGSGESASEGSAAGTCTDGVLGAGEVSCYRVSLGPATWQAAQADCVAWQGTLVEVETPEEDTFINGIVGDSSWIGGSDTVFDNVFTWTDGSPIGYGNWGLNQPDRFPGPDCVEKRGTVGRQWFDQPCTNERAFVCEKAAASAP